jgi:hypothetical protein
VAIIVPTSAGRGSAKSSDLDNGVLRDNATKDIGALLD